MRKILIYFLFGVLILFSIFTGCFFIGRTPPRINKVSWGVNFSQKQAQELGLNWKENYLALLNDLGVKKIKIATYWDLIEAQKYIYNFNDLDWQVNEANSHKAKIILVVGMKSPRWPECHIPQWAKGLSKKEQQKEILSFIRKVILRYRYSPNLEYWQVENEPFFHFGKCPWSDGKFLRKEVELVKSLDGEHPIIISDSGEYSLWFRAARIADVVGITMYKKVWFKEIKSYVPYPFPPVYYWRRAELIKRIFHKKVICVELQAEPWGPVLISNLPLTEQDKTMNLKQFRYNIKFARRTDLGEFYLWGAEWWYWLKEKQNNPKIWNEAKLLFQGQK